MKFYQKLTVCSVAQYKTFAVNVPLIFASSHFIIIVYIYTVHGQPFHVLLPAKHTFK